MATSTVVVSSVTIPQWPMPFEIVGRDEELASVRAFLGRAEDGPAALVLEGEAGIGKSTLWLAGVEHARSRGLRVLSSRPAEAERGLAHAGLGDLLEDVLDEVLPSLSAPRRRALEVALLLEEADADAVDPRALGIATRNALAAARRRRAAARRDRRSPVVRRVVGGRARVRAAKARGDAGAPAARPAQRRRTRSRPALEQALGAESVRHLPVRPLSVGALHQLLRDRLGRPFARQTLLRIHERSGGNPFFALELARVLDADVDPAAAAAGSGDARGARAREDLRAAGVDPRGARARLGAGHAVGVAARARGRPG